MSSSKLLLAHQPALFRASHRRLNPPPGLVRVPSNDYNPLLPTDGSTSNSFTMRSYAKCVRNPRRMCSYKFIGLKVLQNEQLQKIGGTGVPEILPKRNSQVRARRVSYRMAS